MVTIFQGDCIEEMRNLPAESVHLIVTSPPYWGLRDYGVPPRIWPESEEASDGCEHEWIEHVQPAANGILHDDGMSGETLSGNSATRRPKRSGFCQVCNAWRGGFGLEPSPELYITHLVEIMREAKRVLRKDGTLWLNLGDSYASGSGSVGECPGGGRQGEAWSRGLRNLNFNGRGEPQNNKRHRGAMGKHSYLGKQIGIGPMTQPNRMPIAGLKPGDLVGIPWRAVFALQADGWWHRRDNIWFKPNPMPESVNGWRWEKCRVKTKAQERGTQGSVGNSKRTRDMSNGQYLGSAEYVDCPCCEKCAPNGGLILRKGNWRCTTSHEYVFQFSKSASYFCDCEAAREQRDVASSKSRSHRGDSFKRNGSKRGVAHVGQNMVTHRPDRPDVAYNGVGGRNRRSVWRIATKPYRGAHFATFPPDLIRPIIAAASPVHCCGTCGAPYAPVVERGAPDLEHQQACGGDQNGVYNGKATKDFAGAGAEDASAVKARILAGMVQKRVTGYRATCSCSTSDLLLSGLQSPVSAIVLDPFGGSGTVGQVAQELGRDAILIELSKDYIPLIEKRCNIVKQEVAA